MSFLGPLTISLISPWLTFNWHVILRWSYCCTVQLHRTETFLAWMAEAFSPTGANMCTKSNNNNLLNRITKRNIKRSVVYEDIPLFIRSALPESSSFPRQFCAVRVQFRSPASTCTFASHRPTRPFSHCWLKGKLQEYNFQFNTKYITMDELRAP